MTQATNARLAGATLLLYMVTGIAVLAIESPITGAGDIAARLAATAAEPWRVRVSLLAAFLMLIYAIALGATFHSLTRADDADLALGGLAFRSAEGIIGFAGLVAPASLLWLATSTGAAALDPAVLHGAAVAFARWERLTPTVSAFAFALGSLCFGLVCDAEAAFTASVR